MTRLAIALAALLLFAPVTACGADEATASGSDGSGSDAETTGTDASDEDQADGLGADAAARVDATPCESQCDGKNCGDDGCGGLCGSCFGTYTCEEGLCTPCQPDCGDKSCGDDGCGDTCGVCAEPEVCTDWQCGPPPLAICLDIVPCLMGACADSAGDIATCIADEIAACGPADSPGEEASATALVTCMADQGCTFEPGSARAECQRGNCLQETVTCSQSSEGEAECHTLLQCLEGDDCPKDVMTGEPTIACLADCLATGTAEAVEKYWELMLCVDAQCLGSPDYDDMGLCFDEETDTGGACGWPFRDCLMSMF
ncbi:MAG: hypothetical protein QF464_15245 [Myxococcota bacterium]|nr:hypothetical protein [Myxococcota bacterium]